jgi:putative ABC transport system permease protein
MSSRWKKVWADFWGNKTRTVLTIITIAVGTFTVGFTSNLSRYMVESMESDFLSARPAEATISAAPMDEVTVKQARAVPGVNGVEGRSLITGNVIQPDGKKILIVLTALEDASKLTVNALKPATGQTAVPALADKGILMDSSAASLGYKPGDMIDVELQDGRHRALRLDGYVHSPTGIPYGLAQAIDGLVTPDTMDWLGGSRDYNQLLVSVAEQPTDQKHVTEVAQAVADRIEQSGATIYYVNVSNPGHHFAYTIAQGMFFVLGALSWLTVLLGCLLIINTVTALMTQQTRYIGIMKATGAAGGQIFGMYVALLLAFGLAALAVAVPLANMAAHRFGDGMAAYLNFYPATYRGYTSTLVQQGVVALAVPLLTALWPLINSVRITVREALSDYGIGSGARPKDKSISKSTLLIPRPVRLSLRNTFRRKARLLLTLFTLVLAGALFVSVFNLRESFAKIIHEIEGYFIADIRVDFDRAHRLDQVGPMAERVPGVQSVEGWLEYFGTYFADPKAAGTQIAFVAPPSDSKLIDPIIVSGRWLEPGDENAVVVGNQFLKMYPDLKVGDRLTVKIDGRDTEWQIVGMYTMAGNTNPPLLYTNYEYISRLIGQPGMVYSLRVITTAHDPIFQSRVRDALTALYDQRGVKVSSTQLSADFIKANTSQTDIFVLFVGAMAALIAVIGGLGLMGTMSINVLERTREIGVMRAIGASNWNIQSIVLVEGMLIGVLSWIVSIALSIPITVALCAGVGVALFSMPLPPVYGMMGITAWLAGILIIGGLASALPAHRASSLTVRDTLAYE